MIYTKETHIELQRKLGFLQGRISALILNKKLLNFS